MARQHKSRYVPALGFHALTPVYDLIVATTGRERTVKQALIDQAGLSPGQRVLDLASGTGTLSLMIKRQQPQVEVVGIDGDAQVIARAQRKAHRAGTEIRFHQALANALPYPDARFDAVFASMFLHHLPWPEKIRAVLEIRRVLKAGGRVHVADWGAPANLLLRGLFLTVQVLDGFENTRDHAQGRLLPLFADQGFADLSSPRAFHTIYGTIVLFSAVKAA